MERSVTKKRRIIRRPAGTDGAGTKMRQSALGFWAKLTADDLEGFNGQAAHLSDALRKRYGWSEDEIDVEIEWWEEETGHELT